MKIRFVSDEAMRITRASVRGHPKDDDQCAGLEALQGLVGVRRDQGPGLELSVVQTWPAGHLRAPASIQASHFPAIVAAAQAERVVRNHRLRRTGTGRMQYGKVGGDLLKSCLEAQR